MSNGMKKKILLMVVAAVVCVAALTVSLSMVQNTITQNNRQTDMNAKLSQVRTLLADMDDMSAQTSATYDQIYMDKASTLAYMVQMSESPTLTAAQMNEYREVLNVTNVLVLDAAGKALSRAQATPADFSRARYNELRRTLQTGSDATPFEVTYETGKLRYYAAPIDTDRIAVVEQTPDELDALFADTASWHSVLGNVRVGLNGYAFAISAKDYTVLYHPDNALVGTDALDAGLDVAALEDGATRSITLFGERLYTGVIKTDDAYVLCVLPESEAASSRNTAIGIVVFVFLLVIILMICYAVFMQMATYRTAGPVSQKLHFNKGVAQRVLSVSVVGLVCIFVVSFYMQTLFTLSNRSISNSTRVQAVEDSITRSENDIALLTNRYNRSYLSKAQAAAYILGKRPDVGTRDGLGTLSAALGVEAVFVFNQAGEMVATNSPYSHFTLSDDPADQSYAFRQLLQGVEYLVQEAREDDVSGELHQYIGVGLRNEAGEANGFVQISVTPKQLQTALAEFTIGSVLEGVEVGTQGFAFAVSKQDGTIAYHPQEKLIGRDALDLGLRETQQHDDFSDYITLEHSRYFATSLETEHYYVYVAVPASELNRARLPVSLFATGVCLICLLFVCALLSFGRDSDATAVPQGDNDQMVDVVMPNGTTRKTESTTSRWDSMAVSWQNKTPEQKLFAVLKGMLAVFAIVICVMTANSGQMYEQQSVFNYVLSGRWERGINVFAITGCLMIICVVSVISMLLQKLLMLLAHTFDARTATICRLLCSFVKYVSVIGQLYYCLALFGVDTATLLASAGILSLIVGLGAKELISDILAGLFIVFEGEFRVGDIVTIDDWRGTVMEIGVRTTKVEAGSKDTKIFNNAAISGVINMTRQFSYASCDVGIEYGESLERVESILQKELPLMKERLPAIKDGPFYKGVTELGESSVNIKIVAQCTEADRPQLCHDMNREMKLLFDKYDINIPFPQIVVNQPPKFQEATAWQKRRAESFNDEQKELSKDIDADTE